MNEIQTTETEVQSVSTPAPAQAPEVAPAASPEKQVVIPELTIFASGWAKDGYLPVQINGAVIVRDGAIFRNAVFAAGRLFDEPPVFTIQNGDEQLATLVNDGKAWTVTLSDGKVEHVDRSTSKKAKDDQSIDAGPDLLKAAGVAIRHFYPTAREVSKTEKAKVEKLATENAALSAQVAELTKVIADLMAKMSAAGASVTQPTPEEKRDAASEARKAAHDKKG